MTSYLVAIATNSFQTCVKMCLRDMPTATENGRCCRRIEGKPYGGGAVVGVRPRVNMLTGHAALGNFLLLLRTSTIVFNIIYKMSVNC